MSLLCHKAHHNYSKDAVVSRQVRYFGWWFLMQVKLYSGFMKQIHKGVVSIVAKSYKSSYFGIDQHLSTECAWGVGAVNGRTLQTDTMQ